VGNSLNVGTSGFFIARQYADARFDIANLSVRLSVTFRYQIKTLNISS